jgi:signal transduction histidine kinase
MTVETIRAQHPEAAPIDVELPPGLGAASGDPDRIQQVLVNLLDNALKYGGPPVRVRVEKVNSSVRVSVADSGPGILPGDRQRIFEKFYRGDPEHTHAPGGTGLGLYISRELAKRMNGRLAVSSDPGPGATFVFELPRAPV